MADLPAVADSGEANNKIGSGAVTGRSVAGSRRPSARGVDNLSQGLLQIAWVRQLGLMLGLAAAISLGVMLVMWGKDPEYKPLYSNLEVSETTAIVKVLEQAGVRFTIQPDSGMVLVPSSDLHTARMKVAAAEVLDARVEGYLLLDQEAELGTSQFMETARYQRAIEGELVRTISSLKNVRSARVLLAIPKQSVFVRDRRQSSASVFVEMGAGYHLEAYQVKAVMRLVANSVPEMAKENVSIVDQHGNLLSEVEDDTGLGETEKQLQLARKMEQDVKSKISNMLAPVLGQTRFNAQVSADVDFTYLEETEEMFNPDLPSIRSEETLVEIQSATGQGGVPGALSNQPPAAATVPEEAEATDANGNPVDAPLKNQRKQATRNYELDRTISHTKHQIGKLMRLTVAVVLDDMRSVDAETGEVTTVAWTPEAIARLNQLIRDSIGFNSARGDRVSVINTSFMPLDEVATIEAEFWTQDWFLNLVRQGLVALLVIFLAFFVLRPVLNMLAGPGNNQRMRDMLAEQELDRLAEEELEQEERGIDETVTLRGGKELALPGPGDAYAKQLEAIKGLVTEDPARVAQVVKEWVSHEA
ncbi:MAG: flagellar M-ring protein FliF [Candidatus Pseudothioglobus sp.]|jgi:flagellar M-ring protein FliF